MPELAVNGIQLSYERSGAGDPVVLVMGTGSPGKVWNLHQVPTLTAAGYHTVTFDNRGSSPSHPRRSFTLDDMVDDTADLIEQLGIGPCRLVGTSLGSFVVQELLLKRPELAHQAVLIASRGRTDRLREAMSLAERELFDQGIPLPPRYDAVFRVLQNVSRRTQNDDTQVQDWLDLFELAPVRLPGLRAQLELDMLPDRLDAYRDIRIPTLVMGFEDDVVTPPHLGRELAEAIPTAAYQEFPDCGHYGYLEAPDLVNQAIIDFFASGTVELKHGAPA